MGWGPLRLVFASKTGGFEMSQLQYWGYTAAMFSGVRALYNRCRNWGQPPLRLAIFDRSRLELRGGGQATLRVHRRRLPATKPTIGPTGMLAIRLQASGLPGWLDRWMCLTSHFGSGHIELAFVESAESVIFYAVRNIAASNLARIGGQRWLGLTYAARCPDDCSVLLDVADWLGRHGVTCSLAPAQDCVDYAVNRGLVPADRWPQLRLNLEKRYTRLGRTWCRSNFRASSEGAPLKIRGIRSIAPPGSTIDRGG